MAESLTSSALNISPLGSGKTVMSVELMKLLNVQTVLIIGPLGTYRSWMETLCTQGMDIPFFKIDSTKSGLKSLASYQFNETGVYFVGRELFQRWSWDGRVRTKTWSSVKPDMIIFDESHKAQNKSSKTFKALMGIDAKIYKLCLSATPTGNSFQGAWSTARWLFPQQVDHSYWRWVDKYCKTEYDPFSTNKRKVVGELQPGEFYNSLPCVVKISAQHEGTLGSVTYTDEIVPMLPKQKEIYDRLENSLLVFLGDNPLITEIPITHRIRLREIALGIPSINDDDEIYFSNDCDSAKIDRTLDILSASDGKVLIATHSKKFAKVLAHRINEYFPDRGCGLHSGEVDQTSREAMRKDFQIGKLMYLVSTIPSMAEGIDGLQYATNVILLVSRDDNRMLMEQFVGRINRRGQTREVRLHELKTEGTIDQGIYSKQLVEALNMRQSLDVR